MATTEPGITTPASPSDVGRHLRSVRKAKGLSRAEVARSAGLTRRELAAYERGKAPVPDSDLWCLAGSCGVDVGDLLPTRDRLSVGSDLGALTVGESVRRLRAGTGSDGVLREYLAMVYELRNLPPGTKPPMRDEDLATLADALGGNPEAIEARLHDLIGANREEAARLRNMILPPRSLPAPVAVPPLPTLGDYPTAPPAVPMEAPMATPMAAPMATPMAAPVAVGVALDPAAMPAGAVSPIASAPLAPPIPMPGVVPGAPADPPLPDYPTPDFDFATAATSIGDAAAADRFFDAPHAADPFAPPPPLAPLAPPTAGLGPLDPPVAAATGFDPFAPPTAAPIDPFAPPAGPPLAPLGPPAAASAWAGAPDPGADGRPDGFVVDLGHPGQDFAPPAPTPDLAPLTVDPFGAAGFAAFDPGPSADAFGGVEMVVLDPGESAPVAGIAGSVLDVAPDGTVVGSNGAGAAPFDAPAPDDADDDPFAVLRVPIDETDLDGRDLTIVEPDAPAPWTDVADAATGVAADPYVDRFEDGFADPFTVPAEPMAAGTEGAVAAALIGDEDPTDEWFDRAAAAADALIAEQLHPDDEVDGTAPADVIDEADEADEADVIDVIDVLDVIEAADAGDPDPAEPPLATVEPSDAPVEPAPQLDDAEPRVALAPIAWSLVPATPAPAATARADVPAADFVAAGTDWEVGGIFPATAMADDGALALRRADVRWALADLVAADEFTVRASVNFMSGAGFGILFRVSTDDSERITGYSFDIDPIYSGGGFLVRQWSDSRQHWKPLAHAPVADGSRLYGAHVIEVVLRNDTLVASIDDETVMTVEQLSRCSMDAGHEPCRGGRLGVQAWSTTEVTVDKLLLANH